MASNGHRRSELGTMAALVQLAVGSDDPDRLIAVAAGEVGEPLGLVGAAGEPLGHAPDDEDGRQALAIARAAARHRLVAPPGWHIARLGQAPSVLGFLAVGRHSEPPAGDQLLELLPALLADQLRRATMVRAQRAAFARRLVTDGAVSADQLRREAAEVDLSVVRGYWPALLTWRHVPLPAAALATVDREARRLVAGAVTVPLERRVVLLYPCPDGAPPDRAEVWGWSDAVARETRRLAPASRAQVIVADGPAELSELSARVTALDHDVRFAPRVEETRAVLSARQFALDRLLSRSVDPQAARQYVDECLGRLVEWDREHRSDLLSVLEAGLDFPRHERAAEVCFMHRNTFRNRMRRALRVLGDDLEDPDVRLAMHVALKLRKLPLAPAGGPHAGRRRLNGRRRED